MEKALNNALEIRHISSAADEAVKYIDDRRKGNTSSLKTRWNKFNNNCMGGIEPASLYTISGISGSGKSSFMNSLETDLFDLNPTEEFVVLSFNFEMLAFKQVGRKISAKLEKTAKELYSGQDSLSDKEYVNVLTASEAIKNYEVYYVDTPGSVEEIQATITKFRKTIAKDKWLLILLDHVLLTKGKNGESERAMLADVQKLFMEEKKKGKTSVIQLSQMNRGIESPERIKNPALHHPTRADLFGSDALYHASDYVIVIHRPETLGIEAYGPYRFAVKDKIYLHIIKNRDGDAKILSFTNNLKYNKIEECEPEYVKDKEETSN